MPNDVYTPSTGTSFTSLGKNTTKFDACGAYDNGEAVPHPSDYDKWQSCI